MRSKDQLRAIIGLSVALTWLLGAPARGGIVLDFSDLPPGTLTVFNPYVSQGFFLTSTAGGFVVNSPDTARFRGRYPLV